MPKLIVSIGGIVIKEVQLTKNRTSVGRRPYNDVVIDNLAVSGEHAVIQMAGGQITIEDLGSTNGTYVNGKIVKNQVLENEDNIEIGKYKIRFLEGDTAADMTNPSELRSGAAIGLSLPTGIGVPPTPTTEQLVCPRVRVLSGMAVGRELPLTKIVTTIGKPGICVASITRKSHGYDLAQVEGQQVAKVNGVAVDAGPITLMNRDQMELGGIRLEFLER